jgi:hypothetical protein
MTTPNIAYADVTLKELSVVEIEMLKVEFLSMLQ